MNNSDTNQAPQFLEDAVITGAMNLSVEEASNIQDTFANFIVERLNYRDIREAIS